MATPIGTNSLNSISRRYIVPEITDNIYGSNPFIYRLIAANKSMVQGGIQIEVPLMYSRFAAGGSYTGYDQLTVVPSDTIKNGALDWKQKYVPMAISGLDEIKANSPLAIANLIRVQSQQAEMEMAEWLGTGLWADTTTAIEIDGLKAAVDDGSGTATYAGILRSTNTWWKAKLDSSTTVLTLAALQTLFGNCTSGGRAPTVIGSRQEQYNRYWALNVINQSFVTQPAGTDAVLAQGGFTNIAFSNVPWLVDSHVFDGPNSSNSAIVMLNEDYLMWVTAARGDFVMNDWQKPPDQDAFVTTLLWAGNLVVQNCARQGKMTGITS